MTKNLYLRAKRARANFLKAFVYGFFQIFSSYPRLMIEVFTRKNFGQRYFRLISAITFAVLLALFPIYMIAGVEGKSTKELLIFLAKHYLTWYIYIGFFLKYSLKRNAEIKIIISEFDFSKYSRFGGFINPIFYTWKLPNQKTETTTRLVESLFEPLPFFVAGIFLWVCSQVVGVLFVAFSVYYSLSYVADYDWGDNYVLDMIDEMIANESLEAAFVDDADPEDNNGFATIGRKPTDPEARRKLIPYMMERDDIMLAS
jgi:hypothetical protein